MCRYFPVAVLLLAAKTVFAFQPADSAQKNAFPNPRYIFYWGEYQCDLTRENDYKGQLEVTASRFRGLLLYPPKMWTGSALLRDFTFKLENISLSTATYVSRLGELDVALGPEMKPGAVMHVGELPLGDGLAGSVNIHIGDEQEEKDLFPARGNWISNSPFLNERLLESVAWGREDITKMSDRDFFTVSEFWQTVRQQPYVEWKPSAEPRTLRAGVSFQGPEQAQFGLWANLTDEDQYRQLLDKLHNYKHLVRQGVVVTLELQTANEYEQLYKKNLTLVPDNDTRLLLRRKRDAHVVEIEWEPFRISTPGLYLTNFTLPDGQRVPVDGPVSRFATIPCADALQSGMFTRPLVFRIDGEPRSAFSFRVTAGAETYEMKYGDTFPDSLARALIAKCDDKSPLRIDSFVMAGADLLPLHFVIQFTFFGGRLLVPNEREALLKASSGLALSELFEPVATSEELRVGFRLPGDAPVAVSLFGPDGQRVYFSEEKYTAGQHEVKVPRNLAKSGGRYLVFLNTPFGVLKREIEMK